MISRTYTYSDITSEELNNLQKRPGIDFERVFKIVRPIIDDVQSNGDAAVRVYTRKFDCIDVGDLIVHPPASDSIVLPDDVKRAFDTAYENIRQFHLAQLTPVLHVETMAGVKCSREARPVDRVGLYIPGGSAILPSSVLMLAIPAVLAGCREIIMATPPGKDGRVPPEVLYAAAISGVNRILLAGGAQAIAALAFGTETVPKVDKILGPGNQYVTAAKMLLQNSSAMVSIDMPAGPSEVLVIADSGANPEYVAADLISQAEHGADSQSVLVLVGVTSALPFLQAVEKQLETLPRKDAASRALSNSFVIHTGTIEEAIEFSNLYAPEHLIMNFENARGYTGSIRNAGSVFIGAWTPESAGDYASGTNHTLPTSGYAKMYSGVSVDSFLKQITFQEITPAGLKKLGPHVEVMAEAEGLMAHKNAVSIRLRDLR